MKTILVPSDFSKNATTALQYAIHLGNSMQAKLVVFHCYQVSFNVITKAKSEEQMELLIKKDIGITVQGIYVFVPG